MPTANGSLVQGLDLDIITTAGGVLLALIGAVLLAVAIACLASVLGMGLGRRARTTSRLGAWLAMLTLPVLVAAARVEAQQAPAGQDVPTVEPPLSRLYGSDDLDFNGLFVSGAISPDGRWLVYSRGEEGAGGTLDDDDGRMNLWIVPLDGGRNATRLTTGAYWDANPLWFPSGDRIVFRSTRPDPGGDFQYLVTLDVDPSTGTARSVPRQLTLEPVPYAPSYAISPDGQEVAYQARPFDDTRDDFILKVLPATGGQARIVWRQREPMGKPIWPDDAFLYFRSFLEPVPDVALDPRNAIRRVPAGGGEAETLSTWPANVQLSADARTVLYSASPGGSNQATYEVASVGGQPLARFTLPEGMTLATCFARAVAECLATTENVAAPLKIVPVNGGPSRQLMEARKGTWPFGWTTDGRGVVVGSEIDGTRLLMSVPSGGGVARELYRPLPPGQGYGPVVAGGRHVLYGVQDGSDDVATLTILDVGSGSERALTSTAWASFTYYNASWSGDRFLYAERKGGRFEFRAMRPDGDPTLLRAFPDTTFPPIIGVHGDRIAWWIESEGRSTLYVAREGATEAREVLTFPGSVGQRGSNPPTWSPDGRLLATGYHRLETNDEDALVVELDESGRAVGDPRVVDGPFSGWELGWTADSEALLVVDADVWMVPIDGETPAVNLTAEVEGQIWWYALSPDGRYLAVTPEVRRGGAIWRLDLEEVLSGYASEGTQPPRPR